MKNPIVQKLVLAIVALVILAVLIYIEFAMIARYDVRSAEHAATIAQAQAEHASAADLIEQLADVGGAEALLRSAIVTKDDLVPFIESLEASARAHSLVPEVTAAQEKTDNETQPVILATLEVVGSRKNVDEFLRDLPGLRYHVTISGLRLSEIDIGTWRASIAVQSYGLPQENE
jgi:Tfp pilus assembly protein PilO